MKPYGLRLSRGAEADLVRIYRFIRDRSSSRVTARDYVARIRAFLDDFETFPERGTVRSDIRAGLRIIGFERRVSIAFVVEQNEVVVLHVLYGGQRF